MSDASPLAALPIDELTAAYDLGPIGSVDLLVGGKNEHHHVVTASGEFVVRRSYRSKTAASLELEHSLVGHLRSAGFPAPEVVPTRGGGTWAMVGGRLTTVWVFVPGRPFSTGEPGDLEQAARALARYHSLVADYAPPEPMPVGEELAERLPQRVQAVRALAEAREASPAGAETSAVLDLLPSVLAEGDRVSAVLARLSPELPRTLIHGGCRRGSLRFSGTELVGVLDFDSARCEMRVLDLGIAVHDFAKLYGQPGSADHKVALDLEVAERFLRIYRQEQALGAPEVEALPAVLVAKRLTRALGRYPRLLAGGATPGDVAKIRLELARVRWLEASASELGAALQVLAG